MSLYSPNIPLPGDDLDVSQQDILNNFSALNTVYGTDHYAYTDTTGNAGAHDKVTLPQITTGVDATTGATVNRIYALAKGNLPRMVYVRGISNASPTPLTSLMSSSTAIVMAQNAVIDVLDFTGLTQAIGTLIVYDTVDSKTLNYITFSWAGGFDLPNQPKLFDPSPNQFLFQKTGNILQIKNVLATTMNFVFWNLRLFRVQA